MIDKSKYDLRSLRGLGDYGEAIGLMVDPHWKIPTLRRKIAEQEILNVEQKARETKPAKTVDVQLLKNARPAGWYEVLGHIDSDGYRGEGPAPCPVPGVQGQEHKLWAGTIVRLPVEQAKAWIENVLVEDVIVRDVEGGKSRMTKRRRRMPIAEALPDWGSLELPDEQTAA